MANSLRLLIVHSSAELYGSDRSLLDLVRRRPTDWAITVVLPETGPLVRALEDAGAKVLVGEVCKIERGMLSPRGFCRTALAARRSVDFLSNLHKAHRFDLIYSNSIAILGGALTARTRGLPHVWHVREILSGSWMLTLAFRTLVRMLSQRVLCNSGETLSWIRGAHRKEDRYMTIWNGFAAVDPATSGTALRQELCVPATDVLVVMVGRINAWKGQKLLIESFSKACERTTVPLRLVLVGSSYAGQEHFEHALHHAVDESGYRDRIHVLPFRSDIESVWAAADIAVVPSTAPEPFGRVAIEAMALGKPVIAAAHGGLLEIVEHGVTGLLVRPRDAGALTDALLQLAHARTLRQTFGASALMRQRELFSVDGYVRRVVSALRSTLPDDRTSNV